MFRPIKNETKFCSIVREVFLKTIKSCPDLKTRTILSLISSMLWSALQNKDTPSIIRNSSFIKKCAFENQNECFDSKFELLDLSSKSGNWAPVIVGSIYVHEQRTKPIRIGWDLVLLWFKSDSTFYNDERIHSYKIHFYKINHYIEWIILHLHF